MIISNQGTASTIRPNPDEYTSRTIAGRQRYFGFWRGERNDKSPIFKAYSNAITAAEEVEKIKAALATDQNLTPQGQLAKLREVTLPFFVAKSKFEAQAKAEREKLKQRVNKVLALTDYDTASNMQHHRLIEAFTKLNPKQRASALLPEHLKANPALARALIAENALVSGVNEDERERIQGSLLSDDDTLLLRDVEMVDKQIAAAEKAFGTATEVLAELAEFTSDELSLLQIEPPTNDNEPPPNLANGGKLKIETETTDET